MDQFEIAPGPDFAFNVADSVILDRVVALAVSPKDRCILLDPEVPSLPTAAASRSPTASAATPRAPRKGWLPGWRTAGGLLNWAPGSRWRSARPCNAARPELTGDHGRRVCGATGGV
jgi:hypothetical protein